MFLAISLALVALGMLYVYLVWKFSYWKDRNVPGPDPLPLLGNFPSFLLRHRPFVDEFDDIYRKYKEKYNFVGVFGNRSPRIVVLSSTLAKNIISKDFKHFHDNDLGKTVNKEADRILGRNPFMLHGEEWKQKRSEITPAFTSSRMKVMFSFVEDIGSRMTEYLKLQAGSPIEAKELAAKFTTDVVSSCIFAADAQSFTSDKPQIREMGRRILQISFFSFIRMILMGVFPNIARKLKIGFISKSVEEFFLNLMSEAITHRETSPIKRVDYLDYLINLQKKKEITELDMAAHGVTFFSDGFETTSAAMAFVLYELAKNPKIQSRLRDELMQATTDNDPISYDTLLDLPYLDQILSESLRLWPPAAFMSKQCTEPTELDITSSQTVRIEKGVCAIIPIWSFHRDPEYFVDPLVFNPDRFSPDVGGISSYREKGCFLPFSEGPRQCLGMRFARMLVKRGIYEIIVNFAVTVNRKTKEPILVDPKEPLISALGGIWLNFNPIFK